MITVKLQGGMGNQMFQLAMAYAQAKRLNADLQLDVSLLKGDRRKYQLDQWVSFRRWPFVGNTRVTRATINENGMPYNQGLVNCIKDGAVLNGYWQTEKYFAHLRDDIQSIFHPRDKDGTFHPREEGQLQDWVNRIDGEAESVMVHIRRGDYLIEPHHRFHGVLPLSYYRSAMDYIKERAPKAHFFMFSDDAAWVRENFVGDNITIVDIQHEAYVIHLMSRCRHSIIANSSFSWWGAWLGYGKKDGVHIAPKQWFIQSNEDTRDIIPELWETVDVVRPPAEGVTEAGMKVLIAVNSWDEDAKRGCHQAIRETWGKDVAPAHLRFFIPYVFQRVKPPDEVYVSVPRDYNYISREVREILYWSVGADYDYTFLVSNDVYVLPQKLLNCGFKGYDYVGFFHEPNLPLGQVADYEYKCNFDTEVGHGIGRKLYNWADGGDGRILSRKAAEIIAKSPDAAAYWYAADDIFIGQVLGPYIQSGEIRALNLGLHKDAAPDNGITWHFKNYPEHKGVRYDPKDGWMKKMYGEIK